jgi:hypothetical protein
MTDEDSEQLAQPWIRYKRGNCDDRPAWDAMTLLTAKDPETAWRVTLRLIELVRDTELLGVVGAGPMSWGSVTAAMPKFLRLPSWDQWLFLGSWAALTGTLFAFGAGTTPSPLRTRLFALISGIVVPVALVFLARFLSRYWPDTSGPFDSPPLTFYLALHGLLAPWLLGRVGSTLSRAEAR